MKLLNFKFTKKKSKDTVVTRSQRKAEARAARAHRMSRRMKGVTLDPLMGSAHETDTSKTRQARRRRLRMEAFDELTKKFAGESRRVRRSMARALGKRRWKGETK